MVRRRQPLVVDTNGRLVACEDVDGFHAITAPPAIIPAPPDLTIGTHIIIAFRVDLDGNGEPLVLTDDGIVRPATDADGVAVCLPADYVLSL